MVVVYLSDRREIDFFRMGKQREGVDQAAPPVGNNQQRPFDNQIRTRSGSRAAGRIHCDIAWSGTGKLKITHVDRDRRRVSIKDDVELAITIPIDPKWFATLFEFVFSERAEAEAADRFDVFAGPINDNEGNVVLAEGEFLEQADLDQFPNEDGTNCPTCMYWWADGIEAALP